MEEGVDGLGEFWGGGFMVVGDDDASGEGFVVGMFGHKAGADLTGEFIEFGGGDAVVDAGADTLGYKIWINV